ncbi:glycoside hydrolase family 31 protein [Wickerhamomyces anomalus NRRL Y-366-8]|uniref:Glucosidase II subunit alpha n=1 Tax=Wickerhamomyces anomalus (strain ATCC 58044 / CBS 1984 / NCYC 433 / NRRL Y-366-8) TaxID=683960 RepID=A0A1E3P866_WICAA|nr:glycoside hydrolase family 31 protein [Wickerhamomyces anomalus NRRL Y-366-8]ODQ61067.1 glycoside hydrolase family 31 protein [Wickerhamomyces anomalus NRRL Y-366-8]
MKLFQFFILLTIYLQGAFAVKDYLFKKCAQSGFCNRNRHFAGEVSKNPDYVSKYSIDESTLNYIESNSTILGDIYKKVNDAKSVRLPFQINILKNNNIRLRVDEDRSQIEWNNKFLNKERFADAWKYAFRGEPVVSQNYKFNDLQNGKISVIYGDKDQYELEIFTQDFKVVVKYNGETQLVLNDRSFLNIEHFRKEDENEANLTPEESSFNSFHDDFQDSKDDSVPFGPESVALDVTFKGFKHVYGIPEHADSLSLKDTSESEPYRLYNVDIFEYETDSRLPMYGVIPFMVAHKVGVSAGIFWVNGADTYVDVKKDQESQDEQVLSSKTDSKTHWISENGILDVVIIIGETPTEVTQSYASLSGNVQLPQLFSLGYHQCRWNYNDEEDVLTITENMDKFEIPYDVIWLDVEYTDAKKYFTWKKELFPDPERMLNKLDETGRTLVAIIDPHLKTGYEVSKDVESKDLALLNKDGDIFKGHCWPGESVWIDTFNPKSYDYWTYLFRNSTGLAGDATNFHIWNDMNEPSIFSGPETSSPKDLVNYGGLEIRSDHNIYGLTFHEATYQALIDRYVNKRPFILTRAYYSGSQRSAAMWTGDNMSKWEYLKISLPMILTSNIAGMPFAGADVGGFFGNPSKELLTRWYQAAVFYPFFRAHAHIYSRRREPWIAGEPYTSYMRDAVKIRYSILPLIYTKFYESSKTGAPVINPLFYETPSNPKTFEIEDEFFLGGLLVKPVTDEGAESVEIYLSDEEIYYDYETFESLQGEGDHKVDAPLGKIPIFIKGGSITPRKDRYRRSSKLMKYDPYTLVIALDTNKSAKGSLYIDDGETFNYENGEFLYIDFSLQDGELQAAVKDGSLSVPNSIEKILIVGLESAPASVQVSQGSEWNADVIQKTNYAIIKTPGVDLSKDWSIKF